MTPQRNDGSGDLPVWQPLLPLAWWNWAPALWDVWLSGSGSPDEIAARAARRLGELVRFARARSPFYREWYRGITTTGSELRSLPPVTRSSLMERFDDWVTDPEVTQASVQDFVSDPRRAGRPYLGRYAVWTSSGTTGEPGVFVHDDLAVHDALEMLRLGRSPLAPSLVSAPLLSGARYAMVAATGGHFAGVACVERMRLLAPALADRLRVFSILEPLPRLIHDLAAYNPTLLATYPSVADLLAAEQRSGRLAIRPSAIWLGGETLTEACRARVRAVFGCRILEEYGASECMNIACECDRGRLHLNSDWALLEPVDREYRPVPPGVISHTVLLTNLANRVQPVIRYDLGDSVVLEPEPCVCGSPFPVLRVEGRDDEVLSLRGEEGGCVRLLPLALTTVVEESAGAHHFQIMQTGPESLSVRLDALAGGAEAALWDRVLPALRRHLDEQGLANVEICRAAQPPERAERSGKLRRVLSRLT